MMVPGWFRVARKAGRTLLLAALFAGVGFPQVDRSAITGTVLDPSGRAVPNSLVVATNSGTGIERRTRSNGRGVYELSDLPVGTWAAVFSAPGFVDARFEQLNQAVGQIRTLNPVLRVASGGEQVTVSEVLPQVSQSSVSLGQAVEQRAVEDLPLNGRNWTSLTALSPGA